MEVKVGDTILTKTNTSLKPEYKGKEFVVTAVDNVGNIQIPDNDGYSMLLYQEEYTVVPKQKRTIADPECPECKGAGKILLFHFDSPCSLCSSREKDVGHPREFPEDSDRRNAWYSAKSAESGSVTYLHAKTGKPIEITEIGRQSEPLSKHPDLKFVGVIDRTKYVCGGIG